MKQRIFIPFGTEEGDVSKANALLEKLKAGTYECLYIMDHDGLRAIKEDQWNMIASDKRIKLEE